MPIHYALQCLVQLILFNSRRIRQMAVPRSWNRRSTILLASIGQNRRLVGGRWQAGLSQARVCLAPVRVES